MCFFRVVEACLYLRAVLNQTSEGKQMRKLLVACVALVLVVGVYAFTPATAGSDNGVIIAQADTAAPAAAPVVEPAKDEPKKEEVAKEDPKKEDPKKEDPKKEDPKKEGAAKEEPKVAAGEASEFIMFESCGKMPSVKFPHKLHGEKNKCDECHVGEKPIFEKKVSKSSWKMAEMYTGKLCGTCHNGKKVVGTVTVFEAKKSFVKCHKK